MDDILVFFGLLLDVANLLRKLLQSILEIGIRGLQLCKGGHERSQQIAGGPRGML